MHTITMQQSILPYFFLSFLPCCNIKYSEIKGICDTVHCCLKSCGTTRCLCALEFIKIAATSTQHNTPQSGKNCVVKGGRRRKQHKLTLSRSAPTIEAEDTPRLKKSKYIMIRKEQIQSEQTLTSYVKMHVKDSS